MSSLQVEVVAADRQVWEGEATQVTARTVDGEIGILPGHTPLLAVLAAGEVGIHTGSGRSTATVDGGFMSVDHDRVTIVSEQVSADGLS
ncbi:F0F1 ATP synthase subunit epsilon [Janibacter massiliensis]|uniref:F0F1 ATP synthase subunit epsilon n=1 Tax=Janibacter massiliensis TaxID=2058291 RepID=UPI000D0FA3DF|nr:F0F1 ATP synthase subunit epsilon [Janibacter massiliensis]